MLESAPASEEDAVPEEDIAQEPMDEGALAKRLEVHLNNMHEEGDGEGEDVDEASEVPLDEGPPSEQGTSRLKYLIMLVPFILVLLIGFVLVSVVLGPNSAEDAMEPDVVIQNVKTEKDHLKIYTEPYTANITSGILLYRFEIIIKNIDSGDIRTKDLNVRVKMSIDGSCRNTTSVRPEKDLLLSNTATLIEVDMATGEIPKGAYVDVVITLIWHNKAVDTFYYEDTF